MKNGIIDWIIELCPEIQEWQAEMIAEHAQQLVKAEREACIKAIKQVLASRIMKIVEE